MIKTTCCYIYNNGEVLMLLRNKKANDINEGKWIGIGGHVEDGETVDQAAIREIKEETGLNINKLKLCGILHFKQTKASSLYEQDIYVYQALSDCKETITCDEGELKWIKVSDIMSLNLWPGDKIFLKEMLEEKYFDLVLEYQEEQLTKVILNSEDKTKEYL